LKKKEESEQELFNVNFYGRDRNSNAASTSISLPLSSDGTLLQSTKLNGIPFLTLPNQQQNEM